MKNKINISKKLRSKILYATIIILLLYGIAAFVTLEPNILEWGMFSTADARGVCVVVALLIIGVSCFIYKILND